MCLALERSVARIRTGKGQTTAQTDVGLAELEMGIGPYAKRTGIGAVGGVRGRQILGRDGRGVKTILDHLTELIRQIAGPALSAHPTDGIGRSAPPVAPVTEHIVGKDTADPQGLVAVNLDLLRHCAGCGHHYPSGQRKCGTDLCHIRILFLALLGICVFGVLSVSYRIWQKNGMSRKCETATCVHFAPTH